MRIRRLAILGWAITWGCGPAPEVTPLSAPQPIERAAREQEADQYAAPKDVESHGSAEEGAQEFKQPGEPKARTPGERSLAVAPVLSPEASKAGIRLLAHRPYSWPSFSSGIDAKDPSIVPVGVSSTLLQGKRAERACDDFGYVVQTTHTAVGAIPMNHGVHDLAKWSRNGASRATLLTPPREWEGIVFERDINRCYDFAGSSVVSYGWKGVASYRDYLARYVPWRVQEAARPQEIEARFSKLDLQLAAIITADIDDDATPELLAYTFVAWRDPQGKESRIDVELGILWKDRRKLPATVSGLAPEPGVFASPSVVPSSLNGGAPLIFSAEYCCDATGVRWATPISGQVVAAETAGVDGAWHIYLEPSATGHAELLIAEQEPVDWKSMPRGE